MDRAIDFLLRAGLLFSAFAALVQLIQMTLSIFVQVSWFWGGSLTFLLAPLAFALPMYLRGLAQHPRRASMTSQDHA